MGAAFFIRLIIETLKPYKYRGLTQRSLAKVLYFFFVISLLYVMVMSAINMPRIYSNYKDVGTNMSSFEEFSIDLNIKTREPVVVSSSPRIVIDTTQNRTLTDKEDVLITSNELQNKFLFWENNVNVGHYDVLANMDKIKKNSFLLLLVFVPAIIALTYTFVILKYLLIAFLFALIASILVILRRQSVTVFETFKVSLYSLTVYYIANIFGSILNVKLIGIVIYLIFFVVALFLMTSDDKNSTVAFGGNEDE